MKKAFGTKQASRFSFGGGSSSNAYMLVYRRIEEVEEEIVMPDVPEDVLQEVIAEEELEKKEKGMMKLKFYWENDVVEMKFNSDFCPAEVMTVSPLLVTILFLCSKMVYNCIIMSKTLLSCVTYDYCVVADHGCYQ